MTKPDPAQQKVEQLAYWNRAAEGWRKGDENITKMGTPVTRRLLELARIGPGSRVLDIASGTGEPALPAAEIAGPSGSVLLTDQSEEMLAFAREKATARGITNVDFRVVDGERLDVGRESFDAVTSRWGVMFMPDAARCIRAAHTALKPGGRIAVAVWGPPEVNPFYTVPFEVVARHTGAKPSLPGEVGIFAFSERSRLTALLADAGFTDVTVEGIDVEPTYGSGNAYWENAQLSGPISREIGKLSDEQREALRKDLMAVLVDGDAERPFKMAGHSLIAAGTKPS